jgi:hypothetical protein
MQEKRTVLRKQVENLFVLDLTAPLPKGGKGKSISKGKTLLVDSVGLLFARFGRCEYWSFAGRVLAWTFRQLVVYW